MGWIYLSTSRNMKSIYKNLRKISRQVFTAPWQVHHEGAGTGNWDL